MRLNIMPKNFDFTDMVRLISPARLASYNSAFGVSDKAELFGLYSWNLELSGALNSLLQLVEVALRNTINEAGKNCIVASPNQHWFEAVPFNLIEDENADPLADGSYPMIKAAQVKDFESGLAKAKKSAQKLLKKKLGEDTAAVATLDQIISQTDFSVWEYILDKSFYDGDATKGFLWPKGFLTAFKKLPNVTGKNKQFQQRDIIRRRIETIRMLRNRVAHNEPIWKDADVNDMAEIVSNLEKKINDIVELTYWISPSLNLFIRNSALMFRLKMLIGEFEIKNATYQNDNIHIPDIAALHAVLQECEDSNRRLVITSEKKCGVIYHKKHRFN